MAILALGFNTEHRCLHRLEHIEHDRWTRNSSSILTRMICIAKHSKAFDVSLHAVQYRSPLVRLRGGCTANDDVSTLPRSAQEVVDVRDDQQLPASGLFRLCVRRMDAQGGRDSDYRLVVSGKIQYLDAVW